MNMIDIYNYEYEKTGVLVFGGCRISHLVHELDGWTILGILNGKKEYRVKSEDILKILREKDYGIPATRES